MAQVGWGEQSLRDLEAIYYFVARDAPGPAASLLLQIRRSVERLRDFPRSGRVVPELQRTDIREILVRNYRIVYRLRNDDVEVLTVHHGARPLRLEEP